MEGLTHLFHAVLQSSHRNSCLGGILLDCAEHQAFSTIDSSELQSVAAQINSNLNEHNSRFCGILILRTFLSQCPDEIFSSNAFSWISQLIRAINDKTELADESESELALFVLRDIIVASSQFPDVVKQVLSLIPKLLTALTAGITKAHVNRKYASILRICQGYIILCFNLFWGIMRWETTKHNCVIRAIVLNKNPLKKLESGESLLCLQSCMKYYSAQCYSFKAAILKLLLNELSSECEPIVEVAAECFALLPLLGGSSGLKGVSIINGLNANYSGEWNQLLSKLIRTLHAILNNLFSGINEVKGYSEGADVLTLPSESEDFSVVVKQNLARKFTNLCRYLCLMLLNPLPAAKIIPVEEVMGLICRALAVTCNSLKDKVSSEFLALAARLPEIHCASFSVLSALIACSRMNLLPYGSLIVKLVIQSLKWTNTSKDWPSSIRKPYSTLRCSAYHCISMWLRISASASCAEDVAEELISSALIDVVPTREKLKLVSSNIGNKHHGKQKRKKMGVLELHSGDNTTSSFASGMKCAVGDGSANSEICCAALEMLSSLLQSVGLFLKPNLHKTLQDTAILILIDIQRSSGTISSKQSCNRDILTSLLPYQSDAKCHLSLLKLLLALVLEPHSHKWPPPIDLAVQIFSTGQNDSSIEVATFCATAKRVVERIIHPVAPILNFPTSLQEFTDTSQSESNAEHILTEVSYKTNIPVSHVVGTQTDKLLEIGAEAWESTSFRILGNGNHENMESSDLIVLSDDNSKSPKHSVATSPHDFNKSRIPSPDVLFIRTGLGDGKLKGKKNVMLPLTFLKNKGIQCTGRPFLDDREDAPNNPPLLVVKVPIETCSSDKMVDFSQQFSPEPREEVVHIEVNLDDEDEPVEVEMNHVDDSNDLEVVEKSGRAASGGENDENGEVMVVDEEPSNARNMNSNPSPAKSPMGKKVIESCEKNLSEVEIVELDDRSNTPIKEEKDVELDEENSKVKEMLNCFADISSKDD